MRRLLFLITFFIWTFAQAETSSSEWGYEDIVNQLTQPEATSKTRVYDNSKDPFANVLLHAGVGFITSSITVIPESGTEFQSYLRGIEASMSVDLFHQNWAAEGAVRAFGTQRNDEGEYSLKEFDLKIVYRDHLAYKTKWKTGIGVAARYLHFTDLNSPSAQEDSQSFAESKNYKYTTPATIFFLGLEGYLTKTLSLGAEVAYRSAMIDETADKKAIEASIKVETHF